MSTCPLTVSQIAQQMQLKMYQGPVTGAVGANYNYTFAVSDAVPQGFYWLVLFVSVFIDGITANPPDEAAALYLLMPGAKLPQNKVTYGQWPIFLSHFAGVSNPTDVCNGVPVDPAVSVRVDESISNDINNAQSAAPFEQNMIGRNRVPLIVPSGCALLAHNDVVQAGGGLNVQLTMKVVFVQVPNNQDVKWF